MCVVFVLFFFFKQKTAYEMRISDWSSDVCSSDLPPEKGAPGYRERLGAARSPGADVGGPSLVPRPSRQAESEERLDFPGGAATGIIRSGLERIREPTYGRGLACLLLRSRGNQRSKTWRIHRKHWGNGREVG